MTIDLARRLKTEIERLCDLEEQLAHVSHITAADPEASQEKAELLDLIATQKCTVAELQNTGAAR